MEEERSSDLEQIQNITGENVKKLRKRNGLSLRDFGDAVGYSHTYVSNVEKGIYTASHAFLKNASKAFGVSLAFWTAANGDQEKLIQSIEEAIDGERDLEQALADSNFLIAEAENALQRINSLTLKGRLYLQLGQRKLALDTWNQARQFLPDVLDGDLRFSVYFNIALCHYHLYEYDKSLVMLDLALNACQLEVSRPVALQLKANIFANQNELESSRSLHSLILDIYKSHNLHEHVIESLHNLADIDMKMGDATVAISRYEEALSIAYETKHFVMICRTAKDLADAYIQMGRDESAKDLLEQSIKVVGNRVPVPLQASLLLKLTMAVDDREKRFKHLKSAYDIVHKSDDYLLIHDICLELAGIYHDDGDVESALRYYKIASVSYKRFSGVRK